MKPDFNEILKNINATLGKYMLWDGYWVRDYYKRTLIISASFDIILYRDVDITFNKVLFFNVPSRWLERNVIKGDVLRLATLEEFHADNPGFDIKDRTIFAIGLHFPMDDETWEKDTCYIVAKHVFVTVCRPPDNHTGSDYTDPFEDDEVYTYPCKLNRVGQRCK